MNRLTLRTGLLAIQMAAIPAVVTPLAMPSIAHAQTLTNTGELPTCNTVASDADGDGFGWELIQKTQGNGEYSSCRVTEESTQAPAVTNRQTGAAVNLVRAYWDANNDIADRRIQCEYYEYNQSTAIYEKNDRTINDAALWHLKDTLYLHEPLSSELPRMSTMYRFPVDQLNSNSSVNDIATSDPLWEQNLLGMVPLWTVNDGIYYGASPLRFSPYVEIIDHGAGTTNAVRIWNEGGANTDTAANDYYACHSLDGNALAPTGTPGVAIDSFITLDDSVLVSMPFSQPASNDYINKETGQLVEFTNGRWNYNKQIAMRNFRCLQHEWEWRQPSVYGPIDLDDSVAGWNTIFHPYTGGDTVRISRQSYTSRSRSSSDWQTVNVSIQSGELGQWTVYDGDYSGWELPGSEFRLWNVENNNLFHECSVGQLTQLHSTISFFQKEELFTPVSTISGNDNTDNTDNTDNEGSNNNGEQTPNTTSSQSGGGGSISTLYLIYLLLTPFIAIVFNHYSPGKEKQNGN